MKKSWILLFLFAIVVTGLAFYVQSQNASTELSTGEEAKHVHHHAGFKVYIDNQLQDYTDFQYMSLSPCSTEPKKLTPEEEQMEKAHLHDQIGDVVHVHTAGATWGDLFKNLGVEFSENQKINGYNNEKLHSLSDQSVDGIINNILATEIKPYQSIIIVVGDQSQVLEYQQDFVSREHIEETEKRSELCGSITN